MTNTNWQPLGAIDPQRLTNVRLHMHDRIQWLARIARSYLDPEPDDSHTALTWDADAFATQPVQLPIGRTRFLFDPVKLALSADGLDGGVIELSDVEGEQAEAAVRQFLERAGLESNRLQIALPYDAELTENVPNSSQAEREELARYFNNFDAVLRDKLANEPGASAVRIWPHHFDLAVLISIDQTGNENDRSIGVGISPGDGSYAEPYLYVTPWPYPDPSKLPDAPDGLVWHTQGFTALIGTASDVFIGDTSRGAIVGQSLEEAIPLCRKLLNPS